jgi:hypothetical protein
MSKEDLLKILNGKNLGIFNFVKSKPELYKEVLDKTSFLSSDSSLSLRIFCLKNNILEMPLCSCGKPLKYKKYLYSTCGDKKYINLKIENNKK